MESTINKLTLSLDRTEAELNKIETEMEYYLPILRFDTGEDGYLDSFDIFDYPDEVLAYWGVPRIRIPTKIRSNISKYSKKAKAVLKTNIDRSKNTVSRFKKTTIAAGRIAGKTIKRSITNTRKSIQEGRNKIALAVIASKNAAAKAFAAARAKAVNAAAAVKAAAARAALIAKNRATELKNQAIQKANESMARLTAIKTTLSRRITANVKLALESGNRLMVKAKSKYASAGQHATKGMMYWNRYLAKRKSRMRSGLQNPPPEIIDVCLGDPDCLNAWTEFETAHNLASSAVADASGAKLSVEDMEAKANAGVTVDSATKKSIGGYIFETIKKNIHFAFGPIGLIVKLSLSIISKSNKLKNDMLNLMNAVRSLTPEQRKELEDISALPPEDRYSAINELPYEDQSVIQDVFDARGDVGQTIQDIPGDLIESVIPQLPDMDIPSYTDEQYKYDPDLIDMERVQEDQLPYAIDDATNYYGEGGKVQTVIDDLDNAETDEDVELVGEWANSSDGSTDDKSSIVPYIFGGAALIGGAILLMKKKGGDSYST